MKQHTRSLSIFLLYVMTSFFILTPSVYAFLGTSSQATTTSSTASTLPVPSTTSSKSFFIKQPLKSVLNTSSSPTSTQIKIIKPKPIQVTLPPKARIKDVLVSDQYIVVLKKTTSTDPLPDIIKKYGISPKFQYKKILKGFSAKLDAKKIDLLKKDSRVGFITQDHTVSTLAVKKSVTKKPVVKKSPPKKQAVKKITIKKPLSQLPILTTPSTTSTSSTIPMMMSTSTTSTISVSLPITPPDPKKVQIIPTGISRILGQSATIRGTGTSIAVLDTGIDLTHPDLISHIMANTTCVSNTKNGNDDNGHGTHVAGIIGALDNSFGVVGVAPEANLISIKVLNAQGIGTWSSVLCGIEWITNNAQKYNIKIANMGFGGAGTSDNNCGMTNNDPLHQALCQSTQNGITYVVAAGNEGVDSDTIVPAAYTDTLITVSALNDSDGIPNGKGEETTIGEDDTFATFSNFGTNITLGAPGVLILSTGKNGTYYLTSGTSVAAAYTSGAAVLYIQSHQNVLWTDVKTALQLAGEHDKTGHSDPSGNHSEVVLQVLFF